MKKRLMVKVNKREENQEEEEESAGRCHGAALLQYARYAAVHQYRTMVGIALANQT